MLLGGCMGSTLGSLPGDQIQPSAQPQPTGEIIGTGGVHIGLLLPLASSDGNASIGTVFKNAASLALQNFPSADVQLLVNRINLLRAEEEKTRKKADEASAPLYG